MEILMGKINILTLIPAQDIINSTPLETLDPPTGKTALMHACCNYTQDGIEIVNLLLAKGVNPFKTDKNQATAIMYAIANKNISNAKAIIDILLKCGIDINAVDYRNETALMRAVQPPFRDCAVIQHLIDKGANTSLLNCEGYTALQIAKKHKYQNAVELLERY